MASVNIKAEDRDERQGAGGFPPAPCRSLYSFRHALGCGGKRLSKRRPPLALWLSLVKSWTYDGGCQPIKTKFRRLVSQKKTIIVPVEKEGSFL